MSEEIKVSDEARVKERVNELLEQIKFHSPYTVTEIQLLLNQRDTKIAALEAEVGELRKDKDRLDWLDKENHADLLHCDCREGHYVEQFMMATKPNVRSAIDTALNSTKGEK